MHEHGVPLVNHPKGQRAAKPFAAEVDLLRLFLLWSEGVALVMGVIFWARFALTRSPFSLEPAIVLPGA